MTAKVSTTNTYNLAPLQPGESAVMDTVFYGFPIEMYGEISTHSAD